MALLWCGGEDHQYQNGSLPTVNTTTTFFRSTYARCAVQPSTSGTPCFSNTFQGGAVTSAWLSFRFITNPVNNQTNFVASQKMGGVGLFSSTSGKGLYIGTGVTTLPKLTLYKFDGTTNTALAAEAGTSLILFTLQRFDMQIVSYGASATVRVYVDGTLVITFTGDVTVTGMTNFDCTVFGPYKCVAFNGSLAGSFSEVMVATDDLRAWSLKTMALTGAGTTNAWTNNTFSNINGTTLSDVTPASDNVNGDQQQYNITDLPSGVFGIAGVLQAARAAKSASPAVTQIGLGFNSGGSVAYGTGATKAASTAYTCLEQLDTVNPITGVAFVQTDMNALQLSAKAIT